jgi:hypothetical protein
MEGEDELGTIPHAILTKEGGSHLLQKDDTMAQPILKRKRVEPTTADHSTKSLIAIIAGSTTPPHDFSKSLELTPARGKILFPTEEPSSSQMEDSSTQ